MQIKNYFVAVGMNGTGIASAEGFGRALAEWIVDGTLSLSLSLSLSHITLALLAHIQESLPLICGSLTSLDSVHTQSIRTI